MYCSIDRPNGQPPIARVPGTDVEGIWGFASHRAENSKHADPKCLVNTTFVVDSTQQMWNKITRKAIFFSCVDSVLCTMTAPRLSDILIRGEDLSPQPSSPCWPANKLSLLSFSQFDKPTIKRYNRYNRYGLAVRSTGTSELPQRSVKNRPGERTIYPQGAGCCFWSIGKTRAADKARTAWLVEGGDEPDSNRMQFWSVRSWRASS